MRNIFFLFLVIFLLFQLINGLEEFLSFPNENERSSEVCCNDDTILSCYEVKLDPAKLSQKKMLLNGISLAFSNKIEPNGWL